MHWGRTHELSYKSGIEERWLGPFSLQKLIWLVPAVMITTKLLEVWPKIPFIDHFLLSRIHIFTPLIIALIFAYFKDKKTNLTLFQLLKMKYLIKRRKRTFFYHRSNMPKGDST